MLLWKNFFIHTRTKTYNPARSSASLDAEAKLLNTVEAIEVEKVGMKATGKQKVIDTYNNPDCISL